MKLKNKYIVFMHLSMFFFEGGGGGGGEGVITGGIRQQIYPNPGN